MRSFVAVLAAALLASAASAQAGNLLTNGSFESGLDGWTFSGNTGYFSIPCGGGANVDGNCYVNAGPVGSLGYLSQTLATTAGETLDISGLIAGNGSGEVHFYLNGVSVLDVYGPAGSLSQYSVSAVASGNDVFAIGFRDDPSYVQFDKLSVTAASGAVPEPASWALMLGGFGLVGGAMRSRRKAAVSFG